MNIPIPDVILTWQFWVTGAVVFVLCEVFKQIPYIKAGNNSWLVNVFGLVVGVLLLCLLLGFTGQNIVFGVLASAISTLAYEMWQNVLNSIVGKRTATSLSDDNKTGGTD